MPDVFCRQNLIFEKSGETYGSPRIYQVMRKLGLMCSQNRVVRLMRAADLKAKQTRRYRSTTKRNKADRAAPNILKRDFSADAPNKKWVADITYITYIATQEGWLYLAVIMDLFSRRIVGWVMSPWMTSDLTLRALDMAIRRCRPKAGHIHHSDQGSQYTDGQYQARLAIHGIVASMNGAGTWCDNASMESFFGTLKSELVHHRAYGTRAEASSDLFYYIEAWYNRSRLHSALGYESPEAYEQLYHNNVSFAYLPVHQTRGRSYFGSHFIGGRSRPRVCACRAPSSRDCRQGSVCRSSP